MFRALLIASFLVASSKSNGVLQSNFTYLDDEKLFKLYWSYNASVDVICFALEVQTLGWVGFGFAHEIDKMKAYDVIVGKVQNGKGSLTDRYTDGYKEPLADTAQDYTLTEFYERAGKTVLIFNRKRNTMDKRDIEIKAGPMLVVYAYHRLDYPSPYKTKHEKQGWREVTLIQAPQHKNNSTDSNSVVEPRQIAPSNTSVKASTSVKEQVIGPVVRSVRSSSQRLYHHIPIVLVVALCSFTMSIG